MSAEVPKTAVADHDRLHLRPDRAVVPDGLEFDKSRMNFSRLVSRTFVGTWLLVLQHALDHLMRQPWSREASLLPAPLPEPARLCRARRALLSSCRSAWSSTTRRSVPTACARGPHPEHSIPAYNEILARWPDNATALRRLAAELLAQKGTRRS